MKLIAFISLIFVKTIFACEIQLPHQILVLSDEKNGQSVFHARDCSTQVLDDLHQIITSTEGRMASYQLKEMMTAKNHVVEITPQSVVIQQLRTIIRDQISLPTGVQIKSTKSNNAGGVIALPAGDKIEVSCGNCLFGANQSINIFIHRFDGSTDNMWAVADFIKVVKAYRLTGPLASFSPLGESTSLREEYIESIPHTDLITDLNSLKFYVTNKPLKTGYLLRKSDLNAINLVRAGLKTDVILENRMIRIKTQGISRSNGSIGELVEVFHPQKNKKYQGKVIDTNKVLVEL